MRYILTNKNVCFLPQEVPKEAKQSYNNSVLGAKFEMKIKASANPQTNKGVLPPHMITKRKAHFFFFQPSKGGHLNLFQKLHGRTDFISKKPLSLWFLSF